MYPPTGGLANDRGLHTLVDKEVMMGEKGFVPVADLEVVSAQAIPGGYRLQAEGRDGAEYQLDVHVDLPMDRETQAVVAELLSQSEYRISRRIREPLGLVRNARRAPAPKVDSPKP